MKLNALFDTKQLNTMLQEGYVKERSHPTLPYSIYNYTSRCQQSNKHWNQVTRHCRGLIVNNTTLEIVAFPFPKFFDQREPIDETQFTFYHKYDGSLGIAYPTLDGKLAVATRGSFVSPYAQHATELIQQYDLTYTPGVTYLFEIVYPEDHHIVDYQERDDLILLGATRVVAGGDYILIPPDQIPEYAGPKAVSIPIEEKHAQLSKSGTESEGLVAVNYATKEMYKIKTEAYLKYARLVDEVTEHKVWDVLRSGGTREQILASIPATSRGLAAQYVTGLIEKHEQAKIVFWRLTVELKDKSRKEQAVYLQQNYINFISTWFSYIDGKPYSVWNVVCPKSITKMT